MRFLLDTHVWIWMGASPERLGKRARAIVEQQSNVLLLSLASVWELALRQRTDHLSIPGDIQTFVRTFLPISGVALLPISLDHVLAVATLPQYHRDPFDRMLVSQAEIEGLTIITADRALGRYGIATIDARK